MIFWKNIIKIQTINIYLARLAYVGGGSSMTVSIFGTCGNGNWIEIGAESEIGFWTDWLVSKDRNNLEQLMQQWTKQKQ